MARIMSGAMRLTDERIIPDPVIVQEHAPAASLRSDIAALICPDWRVASLIMDARTGQVIFANSPCLQLLSSGQNIQIVAGRFTFATELMADRFYALLDRLVCNGLESAAMIERDGVGAHFMAITVRNPQGFFRDVLNRCLGSKDDRAQFVIVEFTSSRDQADWFAMRAFAQTFALSPAEADLCDLMLRGLAPAEISALKMRDATDIDRAIEGLLTKVGCKNPGQLVRLVMTLCPPTRLA